MFDRWKRGIAIVSTFRNAPMIYFSRLIGREVPQLRLWNGVRFAVENSNNNLGTVLEVFSTREYRDVESVKNERPIIIDVGANIGTFTVWAALLHPNAHVYAYEPEEMNYSLLLQNIALNGIESRVMSVRSAVGGVVGDRTLSIAGESSGKNSLSYDVGSGVTSTVPCTTLKQIFSQHNITHCDCLKVDCEGAEYELLYATPPDVLAKIHMIVLEWHPIEGQSILELENFLRKHNYTVERSPFFSNMLTARKS